MERRELLRNLGFAALAAGVGEGTSPASALDRPDAMLVPRGKSPTMRVAAVQLAIGADVEANLQTCLRMIDAAAACQPNLIVLPEFCNHWSTVKDTAEGYEIALEYDGPFLKAIARKAIEHRTYVALDVTVRKAPGVTTGANVLFDPSGTLVATSDKQVLMGSLELKLMKRASEPGQLVDTPFGRIGMFSCMDGVLFETPRCVALQGAQLMINTLNSWALDEASLHVPVRAAENKTFVVAANKVGLLLPLADAERIAASEGYDARELEGAGECQILAPDGTVLAKAPRRGEAFVFADINLSEADDKRRPDGTDIYASRRPELYRPIAVKPGPRHYTPGVTDLKVGVYQPAVGRSESIDEMLKAVTASARAGVKLIVLPELHGLEGASAGAAPQAIRAGQRLAERVASALAGTDTHVALSVPSRDGKGALAHTGLLVGSGGIVLEQAQLHACARHPWATARGQDVVPLDLPWGRVALVVGGDTIYPETFRLAALKDVEVVAAPTEILERWEVDTGLLERGAENRLSIVAASRKSAAGAGLIVAPGIVPSIAEKPFRANLNLPELTKAAGALGVVTATVHPVAGKTRLVAAETDVVDNRPWWLLEPMLRPVRG
jgi:predicted amidohydrolase